MACVVKAVSEQKEAGVEAPVAEEAAAETTEVAEEAAAE